MGKFRVFCQVGQMVHQFVIGFAAKLNLFPFGCAVIFAIDPHTVRGGETPYAQRTFHVIMHAASCIEAYFRSSNSRLYLMPLGHGYRWRRQASLSKRY